MPRKVKIIKIPANHEPENVIYKVKKQGSQKKASAKKASTKKETTRSKKQTTKK